MPKVPTMSSKELAKLLEKGGATLVRQGSTDQAIFLVLLPTRDIQLLFRWGRRVWIQFTVRGFFDNCSLQRMRLRNF